MDCREIGVRITFLNLALFLCTHCRDAGVSVVVRGAVISGFMSRQLDLCIRVKHYMKSLRLQEEKVMFGYRYHCLNPYSDQKQGVFLGKGTLLFKVFQ